MATKHAAALLDIITLPVLPAWRQLDIMQSSEA